MVSELSFRNLPFVPAEGQVIYVESFYDKKLNDFIRNNYEWLRKTFHQEGLEFCYLPLLAEEAISYNAPYLSDQDCKDKATLVPSLSDYLDGETLDCPVLVFGHDWQTEDADGHVTLQSLSIQKKLLTTNKRIFLRLANEIQQLSFTQRIEHREAERKDDEKDGDINRIRFSIAPDTQDAEETQLVEEHRETECEKNEKEDHKSQIRFSISPKTQDAKDTDKPEREENLKEKDNGGIRFSIGIEDEQQDAEETDKPERKEELKEEDTGNVMFSIGIEDEQHDAEEDFDSESLRLIDEIKTRIESLRNRGVNTMFLHKIIDAGELISRLRVTKDFRIFLIDYRNMEIKMPVLPKSVFMLFLRHPEGIRFKELSDYYSELLEIYLKMRPIGGRSRHEQSIRDITDPCSNSINEKCARIREAFVANFDDRLAKNYYVTGKRGEPKRIILDKTLILWDN